MAEYVTEQKKTLKKLLRENCDRAYTIDELMEKLSKEKYSGTLGKSTVYRLITHLVEEGSVKRFVKGNSRKFVYQAVVCERCDTHLHLRCTDCGKIIHLDERVSDELLVRVKETSDFSVSERATVLLGKCSECRKLKT